MPGSCEGQYIRLERFNVSINVDSRRCWKSPVQVLSSDEAELLGNVVTLSLRDIPELSVEIRVSYELGRMLGSGEVVGKLETSWDELLNHDQPFELSFPSICGDHPSLTLKAAAVHPCDDQDGILSDASNTGPRGFSHQLRVGPLTGYILNDYQDINTTTSLFREALALRPHPHPDHPLSLNNLILALVWRHNKKSTAADIRECAQLYHELLPLCPEGTYLRDMAAGAHGVDYVIYRCNNLPIDASDEGICLRRVVLELCPLGHQFCLIALDKLSAALGSRFTQCGNIDVLDEGIQFGREAVSLCPEGHSDRNYYLNNLASSLNVCFNHQGKPNDLDEATSGYEETLHLCPIGHESRDTLLGNLGLTRFNKCSDIDDITQAVSLYCEALTLCPHGHPRRDTMLSNLALALNVGYDKLHVNEDLNEAIDRTLSILSAVLCSRFTETRENEDVEEAIQLCQEALASLPSLHPDRCVVHAWLQGAYMSRYPFRQPHDDVIVNYLMARGCNRFSRYTIIAVELVEQGRGQQWSLASRLRTPLEDLKSASPQLAQKLSGLNMHLSHAQGSAGSADPAAADRAATEYRRLTRQWEAAVAEIRNLRAFSRFLLPPSYEDLQAAAHQGPVIILVASQYSCSAIIIQTSGEPHHVPLPSIALADLKTLKDRFTRAIQLGNGTGYPRNWVRYGWCKFQASPCKAHPSTSEPLQESHQNVGKPQKWLTLSQRFRCGGMSFTGLCLKLAPSISHPILNTQNPPNTRGSRQLMKKRVPPSFVAIGQGQPGAGKGKALLAVDSELELVHTLVPTTAKCALQGLEEKTWVHLACHGKQDPMQPYNSHFVMRDQPLMLLDIMERDIPHAEFAFLSACHTAIGDEETPDEVIYLAAGLQFSGFKSVVGTLWGVDDAVAKHVVEAFYKYMFHPKEVGVMDPTKAAWALNCATHAVKTKVLLEQRMVFIHIGV
ncbi:CHAT domain-containing protein [Suillus placidus]|uniref:CHAT domain-containing protein n=1 Tax=Suillus placidus TaxID=48579 RepID=A0A9P7D0Y4_9AGAM|nr:CHAT domain-containing protein [Suillus placidus]